MTDERRIALLDAMWIVWGLFCRCRCGAEWSECQLMLHAYYYLKVQLGMRVPMYERIHYGNKESVTKTACSRS